MADNNRTFQDILKEQKKTNRENEANAESLSDTTSNALISVGDTITSGLNSTVNAISGGDDAQLDMFDSLNENIAAMGRVMEDGNKQDAELAKKSDAKAERQKALKESGDTVDTGLEDGKKEFGEDLQKSFSGVIAGLKGIFFGAAGIFAGIYLFIAALGNEKFRNVVFGAVDAVKGALSDFNSLINGEMGLLEFLKENALTIAAITALLMPVKTFGLLLSAVKFLPAALATLQMAFATMKLAFVTSILPILGPIILVVGAVVTALYGIKGAVEDGLEKFKETGSVLDGINMGIASLLAFIITLPAKIFTTLIDGALGLLEFFSFGFLNFDDIQKTIEDFDMVSFVRDAIFDFFKTIQNLGAELDALIIDVGNSIVNLSVDLFNDFMTFVKGIAKKIYDPDTGAIFGKVLPPFPSLGDVGTFLKEKAKLIYDSDTGAIFGYQLPKLPSISGMFDILTEFGKKIYDPETGAIFGFTLPSLSDLNPLKNFSLPTFGFGGDDEIPTAASKEDLKGLTDAELKEQEERLMKQFIDSKELSSNVPMSTEMLKEMIEKEKHLVMLMDNIQKKLDDNAELTASEKAFIQQVNVVKGGDSVSQSSSTGFSTKKSAQNDDYTVQALATSQP